jgi:hypothetical protein
VELTDEEIEAWLTKKAGDAIVLHLAAHTYFMRQIGNMKAKGAWKHIAFSNDTKGARHWYPDPIDEYRECCNTIQQPHGYYGGSLEYHCSTAIHVANLFGVKKSDLLKEAKKMYGVEKDTRRR